MNTIDTIRNGIQSGSLLLPRGADHAIQNRCDVCGQDHKCKSVRRGDGRIAYDICPSCANALL